MAAGERFEELIAIMRRLRGPGGCPWDREQTHRSIRPYLLEEAYEVAEAIHAEDDAELCSELGDLLLQIVFHAQMASEEGRFDIEEVVRRVCEKLVRRHPHVFGETHVEGKEDVLRNWARIKAEERRRRGESASALAGVPRSMPALLRAQRLGEKATHAGFDWPDAKAVLTKVREELAEIESALDGKDRNAAAEEIGDLLLAVTSLARHVGASAEELLHRAADRFETRFRRMEDAAEEEGQALRDLGPSELDELWERAKQGGAER